MPPRVLRGVLWAGWGKRGVPKPKKAVKLSSPGETTLRDLSEELGVSLTTISRALRGKQGMSDETRERIKAVAERRGYVSNKAGATLSTGRLFSIGYIIPGKDRGPTGLLQADVMRGMLNELTPQGYSLHVYSESYFGTDRSSLLEAARRLRVDALALTIEHDDPIAPSSHPLPFPLVLINRRVAGLGANFVVADEERGGMIATAHLIESGHRRIAHIGGPSQSALERRLHGYRAALDAAGIAFDPALVVHADDVSWRGGYHACATLFERSGDRPTALFCGSDILAFGVLKYLENHAIRVPQDVAISSFDDSMFAEMTDPGLTSVRKSRQAMGREAARMLLALIDGKAAPAQVVLPVELIVRGSSDRPAAGRRAKALPGKVDAPEPGSGRIRSDGEIGGSTVG
ncbi:MAG: hypothetical protein CMN73_12945 [Sphingomonas sp.]|nr:hypothetical protein [Sphingomonas sp.]